MLDWGVSLPAHIDALFALGDVLLALDACSRDIGHDRERFGSRVPSSPVATARDKPRRRRKAQRRESRINGVALQIGECGCGRVEEGLWGCTVADELVQLAQRALAPREWHAAWRQLGALRDAKSPRRECDAPIVFMCLPLRCGCCRPEDALAGRDVSGVSHKGVRG